MSISAEDIANIERTGEYFKKVLRDVFTFLPNHSKTISGLSRWANLNMSTCQRIINAMSKSNNGLEVMLALPGLSGIEQFVDAIGSKGIESIPYEELDKMVNEYRETIYTYASSQSDLKRKLMSAQKLRKGANDAYGKLYRKKSFESNKDMIGESVDLLVGIHFLRVNPENPDYVDELIISLRKGVHLAPYARPFVQNYGGNLNETNLSQPKKLSKSSVNEFNSKCTDVYVLSDFSETNIEQSFAEIGKLKNALVYNHTYSPIDGEKFDIAHAFFDHQALKNPINGFKSTFCQGLIQRSPARRLMLLTVIDKELDKIGEIQGGCYPSSVKMHEVDHHPEDLWYEKFGTKPEVKLFSPSVMGSFQDEQIDELIGFGFNLLNEKPKNFVGYSMDVNYPIWLTTHRFYMEFD